MKSDHFSIIFQESSHLKKMVGLHCFKIQAWKLIYFTKKTTIKEVENSLVLSIRVQQSSVCE